MASYEIAQEVLLIARRLIRDYHKKLKDHRVEYLFLVEKPKKKAPANPPPPGEVKVITGLNAYLAADTEEPNGEPFFVVLMRKHVWARVEDERKREAMVDYYLQRCGFDEKTGAPKKRDFDVAGYTDNLRRYGPWYQELKEFLDAGGQFTLPLADPPPDKSQKVRRTPRRAHSAAGSK